MCSSSDPSLLVRPGGEADLPAVLALYGQPDFNGDNILSLDEAKAKLARFAAYPDYTLYVAERDGTVVGTFCLMIIDNIARRGRFSGLIEAVVVASGRQGEGLGKAMLRRAIAMAGEKGCYKVALSSGFKTANAHAFYDSLGFERHGISFLLPLPEPSA
ncbi:GNAT family N-acetyltransferase [Labrys monachus]|uniref:GNAT superfamily N-acetyltransferase n=1 Tax=Labrys monachus TaxID=217067 RepID=A0ABU0FJ86_9HYPH|nr:GNAT family N-acetyltransferase [Labrys monachus]MDQ0394677.1 GNAT superfamily N-acetyltransferase [Labrys monachus]